MGPPKIEEVSLAGGNVSSGVVRVGDTVRRPSGPWTPTVHAFLTHLWEVGCRAAPRPLGIDDQGREVLTFAPGSSLWSERFALLDPASRLARVARMIRELHDAAAEFAPPSDAVWQRLIPPDGDEQIIHHDLAPWNLIVPDGAEDSGVGWQWIDWDVAGPGSRLWDLAYAAHGFVPLSDDAFRRPDRQTARRLSVFADAYDLSDDQRHALVPLLVHRTRSMYEFLHDQAKKKVQPWTNLWEEGHGDTWQADARYIEERQELWYHALLT